MNPGMMNLIAVGVDDVDLAVAANRVADLGGGIAVAVDDAVVAEVALPLYGIVSDRPLAEVSSACIDALQSAAHVRDLQSPRPPPVAAG